MWIFNYGNLKLVFYLKQHYFSRNFTKGIKEKGCVYAIIMLSLGKKPLDARVNLFNGSFDVNYRVMLPISHYLAYKFNHNTWYTLCEIVWKLYIIIILRLNQHIKNNKNLIINIYRKIVILLLLFNTFRNLITEKVK